MENAWINGDRLSAFILFILEKLKEGSGGLNEIICLMQLGESIN